jgi:hypothetical protein
LVSRRDDLFSLRVTAEFRMGYPFSLFVPLSPSGENIGAVRLGTSFPAFPTSRFRAAPICVGLFVRFNIMVFLLKVKRNYK